jgi:hypothetical protein
MLNKAAVSRRCFSLEETKNADLIARAKEPNR